MPYSDIKSDHYLKRRENQQSYSTHWSVLVYVSLSFTEAVAIALRRL